MNSKRGITFSIAAIAAAIVLFASGPIISSQQALAFAVVHGHAGYYHRHYFYHGHYFYHHPYYRHYFYHPYHHFYGHYHFHGHFY